MSQFVWTEDHVQDFTRQNPLIQIDAQSLVTDQLIDCLRRDELDAVISNVYINDPVYQMDTLLPRPIYAVVHQSDPLSARPVLTPKDIASRTNIFICGDKLGADYFQTMMAHCGLSADIFFCTDSSLTTIFSTIASCRGVFLTSAIFNMLVSPAECVCVPFETGLPRQTYNMDIHLIYARENPRREAIQRYGEYLLSHIRTDFLN